MQQPLGFFQGNTFRDRYQVILGHHLRDFFAKIRFKSKIPIGHNPHQMLFINDRDT